LALAYIQGRHTPMHPSMWRRAGAFPAPSPALSTSRALHPSIPAPGRPQLLAKVRRENPFSGPKTLLRTAKIAHWRPRAAEEEGRELTVGEDAAVFELSAQSPRSWALFFALLTGVLALIYAVRDSCFCVCGSCVQQSRVCSNCALSVYELPGTRRCLRSHPNIIQAEQLVSGRCKPLHACSRSGSPLALVWQMTSLPHWSA
jgi:hypothetical protein